MVAALSGHFNEVVEQVIVIDCRYPYEFEGGHIKVGALYPVVSFVLVFRADGVSLGSGGSELSPGEPGGGVPPQDPHRPLQRRETRRHRLPLRVLLGARPPHVPLRQGAGPRLKRLPQTPLPRALHPQGGVQGLLPPFSGQLIAHRQVEGACRPELTLFRCAGAV